jgi:hypothetical protein
MMEFRESHMRSVNTFARSFLSIEEIRESCLRRYAYLFGRIRSRQSAAVPSDGLRRILVVESFLRLVQARRWSLERLAKITNGPTPIWNLN